MQTIYNCNKFLGEVVHLLTNRNAGEPIFLSMPVCVPSVSRDPQNMRKGHPLSYSKYVCKHAVYIWLHILHYMQAH